LFKESGVQNSGRRFFLSVASDRFWIFVNFYTPSTINHPFSFLHLLGPFAPAFGDK